MSLYNEAKEEVSLAGTILRWGLLVLVVAGVLGAVANGMGLVSLGFFSPKVEAIRYKTFQESQSYNEGMIRDLQDIQREYMKANPEQRQALRGIALHRFSVYPTERLPADLQAFYQSIQGDPQ